MTFSLYAGNIAKSMTSRVTVNVDFIRVYSLLLCKTEFHEGGENERSNKESSAIIL